MDYGITLVDNIIVLSAICKKTCSRGFFSMNIKIASV